MAAILGAWLPLSLLLFSSAFLSSTAASASHLLSPSSPQRRLLQSNSPPPPPPTPPNRNIQTFFPSLPSPAFPNLVPPPPPPPPPFPQPPPTQPPTVPPPKSQDNKVTTAVVATAASSFAVSGLLFLAFHRFSAKRRREAHVIDSGKSFRAGRQRSRTNLELKGVIVDENGLDAIYWREFNKEDQKRCRHCNHALEPSGRREQDNATGPRPRNDRRIQEAPLIPPGSVNSSSRIFHEPRFSSRSSSSTFSVVAFDSVAARARPVSSPSPPSPPANISSPSPPANISTPSPPRPPPLPPGPVPPPPPPPVMKANASPTLSSTPAAPPPPPPRPPVMKTNASPAPPTAPAPPPPPPPPPVMKVNASPPPPPPPRGSSGAASSSFRPPPAPAQASDGGPKKLKPLHWDKVNPSNADHSMVWDKISGGSFR